MTNNEVIDEVDEVEHVEKKDRKNLSASINDPNQSDSDQSGEDDNNEDAAYKQKKEAPRFGSKKEKESPAKKANPYN